MEKEIKINDFIRPVRKRFLLIIIITVTMSVLAGIYTIATKIPLYQSSTRIFIPYFQPDSINTMGVLVKDPTVLDKVAEALSLKQTGNSLSGKVNLTNENGSQFVKITVIDSDPERAAKISNTTAQVFINEIGTFLGIYDARVLSEAKANPYPINDNPRNNMDIGFAVGLVLSIGIVLLLDSLDESIRSEKDVNQFLGIPVLGNVSKISRKSLKQPRLKGKGWKAKGEAIDA